MSKLNPFCIACGVPLGFSNDNESLSSYNGVTAQTTIDWCNIYRMIYDDTSTNSLECQYRLSGASRLDNLRYTQGLTVPRDRDNNHNKHFYSYHTTSLVHVYYDNIWKKGFSTMRGCGIPVHAQCWILIERIIGPLAEKELNQFLFSLRLRFKSQPFGVQNCITGTTSKRTWVAGRIQSKRQVILTDEERLVPVSDPIDIPAIRKLIGESKRCRGCHLRTGQKPLTRSHHIPVIAPSRPTPVRLPLDIQFLILDHLTQWPDTINALVAFHWQLPESYWRYKAPRKFIFEIDDLFSEDQVDGIDWKYLCLGIERLQSTSHGLKNRALIFRVLEGTRNLFFAMLEEGGKSEDGQA